jgi:DNA-binding MarR family transcriptional regulator
VLSKLARDGGERGLTPSVLADAAGVAPSSMTHRLDRMTQRGLVSRLTDPENRVRVLVTLTDEGWALFRSAIQESDMVEADILQPLSEQERVRLAELLDGVIDGLEALEHRGRPVQSQPSGRSSAGHLGLR